MRSLFIKKIRSERFILYAVILLQTIALLYFLERNFHRRFSPPREISGQTNLPLKEHPLLTCTQGDSDCAEKNRVIRVSRLSGTAATFAAHQCDGPRPCPTPAPDREADAISAVRRHTKEETLELLRMTGITPAGMLYYCAEDSRCFSIDTASNKVVTLKDGTKPSPTPAAEQ